MRYIAQDDHAVNPSPLDERGGYDRMDHPSIHWHIPYRTQSYGVHFTQPEVPIPTVTVGLCDLGFGTWCCQTAGIHNYY